MAVGTVSTSILTDIANAIRYKAGVATLFKPREMAAAVSALDGTDAGDYQEQPYMALESGVLPESVFSDIAAAIRGQNGLSTRYQPGDMAAAILALEWDVGLKPRAVLTSLGTLEFNYVDGRHCYSGGVPVNAWEIDPAGYSSASARPYDSIKLQVKKVVIHSSWPQVGMRKADYLFNAFQSMTEVSGFENLSGITSAAQMFSSCSSLETIYATSFSNAGLSGSLMFNGCSRLVGGTDGFVPSNTSGASVCKIGTGGVLTDPNADARTWFWAHFYDDGEAVLTASSSPDPTRTLRASGRICAIGKYVGLGFTPWDGMAGPTHRQYLTSATFAADMSTFSYLNLVLQLHESREHQRAWQPLRCPTDALHIQLLRGDHARLPRFRPIDAHGPVLLLLGLLVAHDDLRGQHLDASLERNLWLAVLLQLPLARGWQRDGLVELEHGIHVHEDRPKRPGGVPYCCIKLRRRSLVGRRQLTWIVVLMCCLVARPRPPAPWSQKQSAYSVPYGVEPGDSYQPLSRSCV